MYRTGIYIIIAWLLAVTHAGAQQPFSRDIWLNEANQPVKVNCLAQDEVGYIWMGTDEGLYRYNGRTLNKVPTIEGVPVTAIAADGERLVVGFANGKAGVYRDDVFNVYTCEGKQPTEAISSIQLLSNSTLLMSTVGAGIYLLSNGYCMQYTMNNGLSDDYVYMLTASASHVLLAATDQGINEITNARGKARIKHYSTANGLPDNIVRVIKPMKNKSLNWVGTHEGGIGFYCSKSRKVWTPYADKQWQWGQINDMLPIGNNRAWVCTEEGFLLDIRIDDTGRLIIQDYQYPAQKLYRLLMDKTGNIWCATNNGLKQIVAEYITNMRLPAPYQLSELTSITCDSDVELWLGQKERLYKFSLKEEHPVMKLVYTFKSPITQLYCQKGGTIWAATFGDGLWYSNDHARFNKITNIAPLLNESILDVSGKGDKIWVAGLNGVEELKIEAPGKLQLLKVHNKSTGTGSDYVYRIFADSKDNIWMATDGAGVCRYTTDGKYTLWDSTAGMSSNVSYNIAEDAEGNIWASTFNKGLLVYDGKQWQGLDMQYGLQSVKITTIAPDANGGMIVVHDKGIDEWHRSSHKFRHYERRQGAGIDTVSATLNTYAMDTAGNVYIPYQSGLVKFGRHDYPVDIRSSVRIRSVNSLYTTAMHDGEIFPYAQNHITVRYEGINLSNAEQLYYRYKLEGYNEDWILTNDESATFAKLPNGNYTFVLQVSMNNMFANPGEDRRSFSIGKPFWMQVWFIVLMLAIVWGVGFLYIRIRERNLRRLSSLQRERMMFEYEHLKSQVNPHFLFNSLNTLTGLIEDDKDIAMQYTTQLSDLYRNMLSHKDKDLIPLQEEWEILDGYIYIQKSRFGEALQLKVNLPDKLKKTKKVVPMALQLLLENAIKHNVVSLSKPLVIHFDADEDWLIIRNNYQPKISKESGAGLGLINIRKRYSLYTRKQVTSVIENNEFIVTIPLL